MSEQRLIEALDDCINRRTDGQTIDTCLRAYPDLADELHFLLLIGDLPRRARADTAEINTMRTHLNPRIEAKLNATDFAGSRWHLPPRNLPLLIAILLVLAIGFTLLTQGNNDDNPAIEVINSPAPEQDNLEIRAETIEAVPQVESTADNDINPDDFPVSLDDALEIALTIFPESAIYNIDIETWDNGRLVWDIDLDDALRGVDVDAQTGAILFFGYEQNDDNTVTGTTDNVQASAEPANNTRESSSSNESSSENSESSD